MNSRVRGGILTFNLGDINHDMVGLLLDSYGIIVRTGMYCAHILYKRLGVSGTVRASFYVYNTIDEINYLIESCEEILKVA